MPVAVIELRGRGGTDKALSRKYRVTGTEDEGEVLEAIYDTAETYIAGLPLQGIALDEDVEKLGEWDCVASYGSNHKEEQEEDAVEYRFSYQAPSVQIYQSLQTIGSYAASGTAANFLGAINVVSDGKSKKVEGFNLAPPPVTFTLAYYPANLTVSPAYQILVESLVGKVNSSAFKGRPAGSVLLSSVQGGARNNAGWSIEYGFSYLPNLTSIPVGGITVASKDGMDLLWAFYDDDEGDTELIKVPKYAYVERIFYRADLNALAI